MKNINQIISEEIHRYIINEMFGEEKDEYNSSQSERSRENDQYANELERDADSGELNVRKLASKISGIPTSTKNKSNVNKLNSIQSALRKKIKREEGFNGGTMHLSDDDVSQISQARN